VNPRPAPRSDGRDSLPGKILVQLVQPLLGGVQPMRGYYLSEEDRREVFRGGDGDGGIQCAEDMAVFVQWELLQPVDVEGAGVARVSMERIGTSMRRWAVADGRRRLSCGSHREVIGSRRPALGVDEIELTLPSRPNLGVPGCGGSALEILSSCCCRGREQSMTDLLEGTPRPKGPIAISHPTPRTSSRRRQRRRDDRHDRHSSTCRSPWIRSAPRC
jgi:hypothetical protein